MRTVNYANIDQIESTDFEKIREIEFPVGPSGYDLCQKILERRSVLKTPLRTYLLTYLLTYLRLCVYCLQEWCECYIVVCVADVDNVVVGVLPYMCDRCGKPFCYEADLRNHMYSSHSRRRAPALVCTWCNRQFSSTSHLASHERIHTGDRPFTCDTCGKQFTQSGSLNVHRRTHVEPQPFPCHVCGQRFASKQYAKKHLAMRHPNITTLRSDVAFTLTST